jgi:hypothetical protein
MMGDELYVATAGAGLVAMISEPVLGDSALGRVLPVASGRFVGPDG